jgi:hypothetical protein
MLQTKALYNLLRLNAAEDATVDAEPWALENLREIPEEELFARLKNKGIELDIHTFLQFTETTDTPEGLSEILLSDIAEEKEQDALYLIIFELWRRLLPERPSLSIFCDELDYQIALYDQNPKMSDEHIQDCLANLIEILDENVDTGVEPGEIFVSISNFCAHDLESFLYDYIADLLDNGSQLYASELLEGFSPYINDPIWFNFLRARLISFTDIGKANAMIHQMIEEDLPLDLLLEILSFLVEAGEHELFVATFKKILPLLKSEEELSEILEMGAEFFTRLDQDQHAEEIQNLLQQRQELSGPLHFPNQDLSAFEQILKESI